MSTAVIVSGTLRELVNASSSWTIPGDYFLIVNREIYTTNTLEPQGDSLDIISENIKRCHVNFNSILFCVDNCLPENVKHHSSVNMINKWKLSYFSVLPYMITRNYTNVIVLRPDIYLHKKQPLKYLLANDLAEDTVYTTTEIISKDFPEHGARDIMNDVLLMMTFKTFDKFANGLISYYLENYNDTQVNGYEVHSMMARFCKEKGFTVKGDLSNYFDFAILRPNTKEMFEHGSIKPEYGFNDIRIKEQEWWQETYGQ
jgi:hypothetical protein